jgi:hypothetical protein
MSNPVSSPKSGCLQPGFTVQKELGVDNPSLTRLIAEADAFERCESVRKNKPLTFNLYPHRSISEYEHRQDFRYRIMDAEACLSETLANVAEQNRRPAAFDKMYFVAGYKGASLLGSLPKFVGSPRTKTSALYGDYDEHAIYRVAFPEFDDKVIVVAVSQEEKANEFWYLCKQITIIDNEDDRKCRLPDELANSLFKEFFRTSMANLLDGKNKDELQDSIKWYRQVYHEFTK